MKTLPITKDCLPKMNATLRKKIGSFPIFFTFALTLFLGAVFPNAHLCGADTRSDNESAAGSDDAEKPDFPGYPEPSWFGEGGLSQKYFGSLYSSGVSFQYWNHYLMMNSVTEHLRNVPMVTYTGDDAGGNTVGQAGECDNIYSTQGMDIAPYGPGYAPATEGMPIYQSGYPVYQNGVLMNQQSSTFRPSAIYRGQDVEYGDPGTLIYSLWGGVVGGKGDIKDHNEYAGYKTEQYGGLIGLDLFCSCDCRNGVFYGYQGTELKEENHNYTYQETQTGTAYNPLNILGTGEEYQAETAYDFVTNYNGLYNGKLKTQNHLIGVYHQFGSEFIYNIGTIRLGYNRVKSEEQLSENGKATGTSTDSMIYYEDGRPMDVTTYPPVTIDSSGNVNLNLNGKYNEYLGGVSFERGANLKFLNMFTFSPRAALDYTFLHRDSFDVDSQGGTFQYDKGNYHSLRSNLGADLALDMYPGSQHLRVAVRGGWVHEFLDYLEGKTSVTWLGDSRTYYGNTTGRDWALVGAGAEWTIVPAFMIFGNYDLAANKYITSNYGDLGVKFMW